MLFIQFEKYAPKSLPKKLALDASLFIIYNIHLEIINHFSTLRVFFSQSLEKLSSVVSMWLSLPWATFDDGIPKINTKNDER